jgi:uroporphyrinogen decarboxylase
MTPRNVVRLVLEGKRPPYVPWSMGFTLEAKTRLCEHYGCADVEVPLQNHLLKLGSDIGFFRELGNNRVQDVFGVVWDRSVDKDIGNVEGLVLAAPTLAGYRLPDPLDRRFFADIPAKIDRFPDRFRVFQIGFSLYERAWTLRGMANLMTDFHDHPGFVHELFSTIADYNIAQAREAMKHDIDAVYFGDDWGQQRGLQMGPRRWREFILPQLRRMYGAVRKAGKFVMIHSCGDVDEVFDDLLDAGLNCFNPFQPEVMDVYSLLPRYRGRLAFHGGLSTQKTLPFGSPDDVRAATRQLLELGRDGGLIFAPAHDVEGDVPLENMLAAIETVQQQPQYAKISGNYLTTGNEAV